MSKKEIEKWKEEMKKEKEKWEEVLQAEKEKNKELITRNNEISIKSRKQQELIEEIEKTNEEMGLKLVELQKYKESQEAFKISSEMRLTELENTVKELVTEAAQPKNSRNKEHTMVRKGKQWQQHMEPVKSILDVQSEEEAKQVMTEKWKRMVEHENKREEFLNKRVMKEMVGRKEMITTELAVIYVKTAENYKMSYEDKMKEAIAIMKAAEISVSEFFKSTMVGSYLQVFVDKKKEEQILAKLAQAGAPFKSVWELSNNTDARKAQDTKRKMVSKAKSLILENYHHQGFMKKLVEVMNIEVVQQGMKIAERSIIKYIDPEFKREDYWNIKELTNNKNDQ